MGRLLFRRLSWVVPALAGASILFWTLAAADPVEQPVTQTAPDVTRANTAPTLPALSAVSSGSDDVTVPATAAARRGPVTGFAIPR